MTYTHIHIYTAYIGQFVAHIPVRADHILFAEAGEAQLLTFNKHLNECKVILNYLVADDTDVQIHLVNCVLGTDK